MQALNKLEIKEVHGGECRHSGKILLGGVVFAALSASVMVYGIDHNETAWGKALVLGGCGGFLVGTAMVGFTSCVIGFEKRRGRSGSGGGDFYHPILEGHP